MTAERGLGEFVLTRRRELGLTQAELARRVGVVPAYLSQIENGHRKWPKKYIAQLATSLRVTESELETAASLINFPQPQGFPLIVGCTADTTFVGGVLA
jgi:transcriptional regulator with XRE-family HTH domain